jgi:hypothetical protein
MAAGDPAMRPTEPENHRDSSATDLEGVGAAVETAMDEHFADAQYVWTSFLVEHLVALRQRFGDLDMAMLLTVIGLTALKAAQGGQPLDTPVNAHSLSLVTGIPRETVRRKLAVLADRGWIEAAPAGGWRLTLDSENDSRARRDLQDLTQDTKRRLAGLVERLVAIGRRDAEGGGLVGRDLGPAGAGRSARRKAAGDQPPSSRTAGGSRDQR